MILLNKIGYRIDYIWRSRGYILLKIHTSGYDPSNLGRVRPITHVFLLNFSKIVILWVNTHRSIIFYSNYFNKKSIKLDK